MHTNLEFRGRWLNIYGNLILIAILTGFTAGIYAPWGYARWQRIITENTYYEDQQLEFDGSGGEAFAQFIIIGCFTLITLGLYIILGFSATRMLRWQYAHTLMPNGQRMEYQGKTIDIFWEWFLLVLFTPLTLGLYYYWGRNRLRRQILTNVSLNGQHIQLGSSSIDFSLAVLSSWLVTVVALALYALLGFTLSRQILANIPLDSQQIQLESAGTDFFPTVLVNWLLTVVILGFYALLGLALLGFATALLRGWEVRRTLVPAPVRSRTPMPVISTPVSVLTGGLSGATARDTDATDKAADEYEPFYTYDEQTQSTDSGYGPDAQPSAESSTQAAQEDEYYDFADYSTHPGQTTQMDNSDDTSDWSNEEWARPQATSFTDEATDEDKETKYWQNRRADDGT